MNKSASIRNTSPRVSEELIKSAWLQNAGKFLSAGYKRSALGRWLRGQSRLDTPVKRLGVDNHYSMPNKAIGRERKIMTGVGAGGLLLGNTHGHGQGYEEGNVKGYGSGVEAGLGQGYSLAAAQAQNTPFLSRLMGKYKFDPSELQGLNQGILKDPSHRIKTQDNFFSRHW